MYRYRLNNNNGTIRDAAPLFSNETSKSWKRNEESAHISESLDVPVKFHAGDYDFIMTEPLSREFTFTIEEDTGAGWTLIYTGTFYRISAKDINEDDKSIEVQISTDDKYRAIKGVLDGEVDIVARGIALSQLAYKNRPILQLYVLGGSFVSNYQGTDVFDESIGIATPTDDDLQNIYGFRRIADYATLWSESTSPYQNSLGLYTAVPDTSQGGEFSFSGPNGYAINQGQIGADPTPRYIFEDTNIQVGGVITSRTVAEGPFGVYLSGSRKYRLDSLIVYARLLTNNDNIEDYNGSSVPTINRPSTDLVDTPGYDKMSPVDAGLLLSFDRTATPTKYGLHKYRDGLYYDESSANNNHQIAVCQTSWGDRAIFLDNGNDAQAPNRLLRNMLYNNFQQRVTSRAYKLADVISSLLDGTGITHQQSTTYSQFLYGTGVSFQTLDFTPMLVPKTNILVNNYDQAATKGVLSLKNILDALYYIFKLKWHVDGSNRLIIEHEEYYNNGGSYTAPQVAVDATVKKQLTNQKKWDFVGNRYKYIEELIPSRVEYNWMDAQSQIFDGYPVTYSGTFVDEGRKEDYSISRFSSDIDYLYANSEAASKDGFFLVMAINSGAIPESPIVEFSKGTNELYICQNGYASLFDAHAKYLKFVSPAETIGYNETTVAAETLKRVREQIFEYPWPGSFDPNQLVKTGLGDGLIQEMSLNLFSRLLTLTLRHEP